MKATDRSRLRICTKTAKYKPKTEAEWKELSLDLERRLNNMALEAVMARVSRLRATQVPVKRSLWKKTVQWLNWRKFHIALGAVVFGTVGAGIAWHLGDKLLAASILSFLLVFSFICSFALLQRMWEIDE